MNDLPKRSRFTTFNLIKTWEQDGFNLFVYDFHKTDEYGKSILGYTLYDNGIMIFCESDFHCSPLHAIDSDETVNSILYFCALGKGDIDSEYFDRYSDEQIAWRDSERRDELQTIVAIREWLFSYARTEDSF